MIAYGEKIRASGRKPIPPYCNESYLVSIEVALSDDGRTVQSLEGDTLCVEVRLHAVEQAGPLREDQRLVPLGHGLVERLEQYVQLR